MSQKKYITRTLNAQPRSLLALALQAAFCGLSATPMLVQAQATGESVPSAAAQKPAEGPAQGSLSAIKVTSTREESGTGPVEGFVAKRSTTATKTDTPLLETPRSISVVTREQIEAQNASTLQEALGYTPGIFAPPLATSSVDSTSSFAIRGFRASDGDVFFQDGTRSKFPGWWSYSGYEPYAFERVEVLRGPASILYGQGQPNGTVNMVTKRPTNSTLHELGFEVGSFDQKELTADFAGALGAASPWSYRLTALAHEGGTQIDAAEDNRYYVAGALAWRPTDSTELILRASFQRNEGEPNNNLPLEGTLLSNPNGKIARSRAMNTNNSAHYDTAAVGWLFEHELDSTWALRSVMRLSQTTGERKAATFDELLDDKRIVARRVTNYESLDGNYNFTLDNHAQARFNTGAAEHTLLVGLDLARQRDSWVMSGGTAANLDLFDPVYTPVTYDSNPVYERTANDQQIGLYLQDQIKFDKRWVLSIGGRQDWAKNWTRSGDPGAIVSDGPQQKDEAFTWQAGGAYLFDGGLTPYLSYAQSYVPTLGTNLTGDFLKPETGRQFEAGVKYQPANSSTLLTAAIFDVRRQNVVGPDPDNDQNRIQRGEVTSRGLELEARTELMPRLSLIGSYAYTRTEVTKSDQGDLGKELLQSPRHTAALWLDHANLLPGLGIGVGLRHIGASWVDELNTRRTPGFTVLDLGVRFDLGQLSSSLSGAQAYLNVKNLGDKTYLSCFYDVCMYGIERTASAGVRYTW